MIFPFSPGHLPFLTAMQSMQGALYVHHQCFLWTQPWAVNCKQGAPGLPYKQVLAPSAPLVNGYLLAQSSPKQHFTIPSPHPHCHHDATFWSAPPYRKEAENNMGTWQSKYHPLALLPSSHCHYQWLLLLLPLSPSWPYFCLFGPSHCILVYSHINFKRLTVLWGWYKASSVNCSGAVQLVKLTAPQIKSQTTVNLLLKVQFRRQGWAYLHKQEQVIDIHHKCGGTSGVFIILQEKTYC